MVALLAAHFTRGLRQRIWCKPRCEWWQAVKSGVFGQRWWKKNLRMSQATFMYTCNKLRPTIEKQFCIYNMCIIIALCYVILLYVSSYYRLLNYASQCLLKRGFRNNMEACNQYRVSHISITLCIGTVYCWKDHS